MSTMPSTQALCAQNWVFEHLKQVDSILLIPNGHASGELSWFDKDDPMILTRRGAKLQEPGAEIVITGSIATTGIPERGFNPEHMAADVFYASVKEGDGQLTPGLVLRFVDKNSSLGSVEDFVLEAEYHSTAKDAQGSALPHFAGLFRSGSLYCLVFEDAGRDLTEEEYNSEAVRDEAEQALKGIHATGIAPHITERSVRRGHDGMIKISTLWLSDTPHSPEEMEELKSVLPRFANMTAEELWKSACEKNIDRLHGEFRVPH